MLNRARTGASPLRSDFKALPSNNQARELLHKQLLDTLGNHRQMTLPGEMKEDSTVDTKSLLLKIETVMRAQHEEQLERLNEWMSKMENCLSSWQFMEQDLRPDLPMDPVPLHFPADLYPADGVYAENADLDGLEKEVSHPGPVSASSDAMRESAKSRQSAMMAGPQGEHPEPEISVTALQSLVRSTRFECIFSIAIVANSVTMGIQVQNNALNDGATNTESLFFQIFFALVFSVELLMRIIAAEGLCGFLLYSPEKLWNWMDFSTVIMADLDAIIAVMLFSSSAHGLLSELRVIRVLRVTRVVRAIRIVRLVRIFRALNTLVSSIISTLNALVWACLLLFLIIYIFSILFTELVGHHLRELGYSVDHEPGQDDHNLHVLYLRFGGLFTSMNTLFMAISGGVDWGDIGDPLFRTEVVWGLLFQMYISFVCFAVLNVMTGVFCESAIQNAARDKDAIVSDLVAQKQEDRADFASLFKAMTNSSTITLQHLETALEEQEVIAKFHSMALDPDDAWRLFRLLDIDEDASLEQEEFIEGCMRLKGAAKSIDVASLMVDLSTVKTRLSRLHDDQQLLLDSMRVARAPLSGH